MSTPPFHVGMSIAGPERWGLWMRPPHYRFVGWFDTQAEAIDYAYRHWPWWP